MSAHTCGRETPEGPNYLGGICWGCEAERTAAWTGDAAEKALRHMSRARWDYPNTEELDDIANIIGCLQPGEWERAARQAAANIAPREAPE